MLAERLSPAQRPHPLPLSLPEDRGQRCSFAILLAQFKVSRLLFSSMISSIHHVVLDIWLFAQAKKKKSIFTTVSIVGISLGTLSTRQWVVTNSTFNTIDDKALGLIISYSGFTSFAQSPQNMSNDPFTV